MYSISSVIHYFVEYNRYYNGIGMCVVLAIAWLFSRHKTKINMRLVACALALQGVIGFLVLRTTMGSLFIEKWSIGVSYLYKSALEGTRFLFGNLATADGSWGHVFAIQVLPMIIFFGAFMALLFHYGIVQKIVAVLGALVRPLLGTTGAETLCAVANTFLGQTEAPLLIRHYLASMTESELFVVMVSGMATISGSILVVYASFGIPVKHLLASSVMAIPAAILIAKIMIPETEESKTDTVTVEPVGTKGNVFEALSNGTSDGLQLTLNVAAMLLSFYALIVLINSVIGGCGSLMNYYGGFALPTLSLNVIFSWLFAPIGYMFGFVGQEALSIGQLIGTKISLNEFFAYRDLVAMGISERATMIATYALCGFSNFSSIGIQIGGIGALVPSKKTVLTRLGLKAVLGGMLANILTAMVAGLLI